MIIQMIFHWDEIQKLLQNLFINVTSLDTNRICPGQMRLVIMMLRAQTTTVRMNMLLYMWTRLVHPPYTWKKMAAEHFKTRIFFDTRLQTALYPREKRLKICRSALVRKLFHVGIYCNKTWLTRSADDTTGFLRDFQWPNNSFLIY